MDDWNKFHHSDDKFEEYRVRDFSTQETFHVETKKKQPYVTKKVFVITLIFSIMFSSLLGAGGFALAAGYFGGDGIIKNINATHYNIAKATGSELSIQEIVAKNENSVVAITTESVATDIWARQYVTSGAGSGVIYSEDGYVLTNNHVIEGANTIKVTLHNGQTYDATLVAADSQSDIAVIKISAKDLVPVTIDTKKSLSVGDLVVAIGNPLGTLAGTATEGIVSALEREITLDGKTMTLLQISSSINPGNSGGGVFDQYGNLVGLVVAKSSGSDVEGLGFAIPIETVKKVSDSLIKEGYVEGRPSVGITILDLTSAEDAMKYGISLTGVYINEVTSEAAKDAGLKPGDLIYMINKEKVTSSEMLIQEIQSHKVGDEVTLTIVRDDKMHEIKVVLQESKN
ncbi:MAG: trypsin-like peptidase domain-containing protein [Firmicutes bacterium]|nr:trypsin-like peptidase domain-containing protein [Bacillota bacterium]